MGTDLLSNSTEGSATPDRGRIILRGSQSGDHEDAVANEGAGVLDHPVDLAASGQKSGATEVTAGKQMGGQEGTVKLPESLAGQQVATVQGSGGGALKHFWRQTKIRRHGRASQVGTGRRQGVRPNI